MRYLGEQVEKEREAERELEKLIDAEVCKSFSRYGCSKMPEYA